MLKEAVIAAVITTAGLLAVSPLAFAGSDHPTKVSNNADESSVGLVNVAHNNVNTPFRPATTTSL